MVSKRWLRGIDGDRESLSEQIKSNCFFRVKINRLTPNKSELRKPESAVRWVSNLDTLYSVLCVCGWVYIRKQPTAGKQLLDDRPPVFPLDCSLSPAPWRENAWLCG